jgi:hypothetical protein
LESPHRATRGVDTISMEVFKLKTAPETGARKMRGAKPGAAKSRMLREVRETVAPEGEMHA